MEWWGVSAHRRLLTAIFLAFVLLAAMNELQGIRLLKSKKDFNTRVMAGLKGLPPRAVISLLWWAPLSTAPAFYEKEFFSASGPAEFGRLISRLKENGRRDFILVAPDDPDVVKGIAGRFRLTPERVRLVEMAGDDYFRLNLMEYRLD
jgi:hypothetical protein